MINLNVIFLVVIAVPVTGYTRRLVWYYCNIWSCMIRYHIRFRVMKYYAACLLCYEYRPWICRFHSWRYLKIHLWFLLLYCSPRCDYCCTTTMLLCLVAVPGCCGDAFCSCPSAAVSPAKSCCPCWCCFTQREQRPYKPPSCQSQPPNCWD